MVQRRIELCTYVINNGESLIHGDVDGVSVYRYAR